MTEFKIVRAHWRAINFKVEGGAALALRKQGLSLAAIKKALGTEASIPTISRAIDRAEAAARE